MYLFVHTFSVTAAESGAEWTTAISRHVNEGSCPWQSISGQ